jgi:RHS repeat-associated protein
MEESHYYPFGLKHKGYNGTQNMIIGRATFPPVVLTPVINQGDVSYKYKYQGQERQDELGLNWDSFKWRNYDYAIGRFMSIDPLAEEYVYNSPYAFAENKIGMGRELEGLELGPFWGPMAGMMLETTNTPPLTGTAMSTARATVEFGARTAEVSEGMSAASRLSQNASRGRATEVEQLAKNGLEKNTESFTRTDPKTGKETTTIPDGVKKNGGTVEIKDVQKQSLTRQLRTQREISNENGVKPELIINNGAKLSTPLKNGGFDIKTYNNSTIISPATQDNTTVPKPELPRRIQPSTPEPKPVPLGFV